MPTIKPVSKRILKAVLVLSSPMVRLRNISQKLKDVLTYLIEVALITENSTSYFQLIKSIRIWNYMASYIIVSISRMVAY